MDTSTSMGTPPSATCEQATRLQSKRHIIRHIDDKTIEFDYRNEGIQGAPPLSTDLPWEHMSGITSQELIVFFPNHTLRVNAIGARLIAEGFPQIEISRLLHLSRQMGLDPPMSEQLALANTVRVQVRTSERRFVEDDLGQSYSRRVPVTPELLQQTPWVWTTNRKTKKRKQSLEPAWSLFDIAMAFPTDLMALPDFGPFTLEVKAVWQQRMCAGDPTVSTTPMTRPGAPSNPPHLPIHWGPQMHKAFRAAAHFDLTLQPGSHSHHQGNRLTSTSRFVDLPTTLAYYSHSAQRILREAPHLLAGELLIHFTSRHGFCMTVSDLATAVKEKAPEGVKSMDRTTYSHRLMTAIRMRAEASGKGFEEEWQTYVRDERFVRDGNQTKARPSGVSKRCASYAASDASGSTAASSHRSTPTSTYTDTSNGETEITVYYDHNPDFAPATHGYGWYSTDFPTGYPTRLEAGDVMALERWTPEPVKTVEQSIPGGVVDPRLLFPGHVQAHAEAMVDDQWDFDMRENMEWLERSSSPEAGLMGNQRNFNAGEEGQGGEVGQVVKRRKLC